MPYTTGFQIFKDITSKMISYYGTESCKFAVIKHARNRWLNYEISDRDLANLINYVMGL